MNKKFYITTPIYYPSGNWHLGTCYTTVNCDAIARFKKMDGYEVYFLTGTDEHGQKVEECAKAAGVSPKAFIDERVDNLKKLWDRLNIKYDRFIRTTDDDHKLAAQRIFEVLFNKGDIYKSEYVGKYCTPCESFWTDSQLVNGKCPDCGREVNEAREESYFFRLSKYQKRLEQLYIDNPEFLQPVSRVNEMLNNFIRPGLTDLCVSRTTFKWGVPVSFDEKHVMYVWVDALSNYLSALGYGSADESLYNKFWPADLHMVGKEIVRFHAIIWPALLMALDLPLPKKVYGHGWLLFDNDKMSKSKGNVVDPFILADRYTADAVRYFLLREVPFGSDGNYTTEIFLNRVNADLANDLGNLLNRTTAMAVQYFGGRLPDERAAGEFDNELITLAEGTLARVRAAIDSLSTPEALGEIFKLVQRANKYIDENRPWALAKNENDKPRLAAVLYNVLETLRFSAVLLYSFIPETAEKIYKCLGLSNVPTDFSSLASFGGLPIKITHVKSDPVYPRFDVKKEIEELKGLTQTAHESGGEKSSPQNKNAPCAGGGNPATTNNNSAATAHDSYAQNKNINAEKSASSTANADDGASISIEDFLKVKLVTAKVVNCEKVEKRDKLLKLSLDVNGASRTIVSGIAQHYSPYELIGKTVVLVSNLKPAKLGGIMSEGMILCADDGKAVILVTPEKEINSGSEVR